MRSIPTWYGGIRFRSKLEAQWAKFLDYHGVPWVYEPDGYEFEDGTRYLPDFWLPDSKQWFEVKGVMTDDDLHKCDMLALESGHDVVVGYPDGALAIVHGELMYRLAVGTDIESWTFNTNKVPVSDEVIMNRCRECGKVSFFATWGDWECRCCGVHDGDHYCSFVYETPSDVNSWAPIATIDIEPRGGAR